MYRFYLILIGVTSNCLKYASRLRTGQSKQHNNLALFNMPWNKSDPTRASNLIFFFNGFLIFIKSGSISRLPGFRIRIRIRTDPHVFARSGSAKMRGKRQHTCFVIIIRFRQFRAENSFISFSNFLKRFLPRSRFGSAKKCGFKTLPITKTYI